MNEKCRNCGTMFESDHGKKYCSDDCRLQAKRRQWKEAAIRRKQGTQNQIYAKICPVCGAAFECGYNTIYCSDDCKALAQHKRKREYACIWYGLNKEVKKHKSKIYKERVKQNAIKK